MTVTDCLMRWRLLASSLLFPFVTNTSRVGTTLKLCIRGFPGG